MIKTKAIATFFWSPLWFYSFSVLTLSVRGNGFNFYIWTSNRSNIV